ncbi:NUDIX domain-containing protein [Kitasatospora aureofaciens]|uniref:NUDIX hydrolase n=1 Tax=Kitasatospora aureofaciens TaxID=1894 RepID=A0A1E7MW82_KITAU|nr:NUDIX hydrolase [Kitasatospora aureofaciens]ARF78265.1 NUDIX hydrolase [Kitasatospora aureofaciens]OEV32697.1 NUDIX hydrolase [Kitasatospora aureofaciens]GGU80452.1 NUDIX hydrolase [Kitasatospora aureofaciens]
MRPAPTDTEAWNAYLAEGNARQARKRVSADVILHDLAGRILTVNPTYKEGWDLPGGMAEANEPPDEAAVRELREELGLEITIRRLLVVDWVAPHGPWDDQIAFIFDAGTLPPARVETVRPHDDELSEAVFLPASEVADRLRTRQRNRLNAAVRAISDGSMRYLRDGVEAW